MNTALAINDVITGVTTPRTNMEVASHIAAGNFGVPSFAFNKEIHDYLISKGGEFIFRSIGYYQYIFNIKNEQVRLYFRSDAHGEVIYIQYLWEDDDPELGRVRTWLTDHKFSHPGSLQNFKIILKTYLNEYTIE